MTLDTAESRIKSKKIKSEKNIECIRINEMEITRKENRMRPCKIHLIQILKGNGRMEKFLE